MPTKKIADLPANERCMSPDHNPPAHQVFLDGVYEHVCSRCGWRTVFTVRNVRCEHVETEPMLIQAAKEEAYDRGATASETYRAGHAAPQPYQRTFLERWLTDPDRGPRFSVRRSRR